MSLFEESDLDVDGHISYTEFSKMYKVKHPKAEERFMKEVFAQADKNKDNMLVFKEFKPALVEGEEMWKSTPQGKLERHFETSDASYDGYVSLVEWSEYFMEKVDSSLEADLLKEIFETSDENEDELLDLEEFGVALSLANKKASANKGVNEI